MDNKKTIYIWSAGGVIMRTRHDIYEALLCHRKVGALWALPKGTPTKHESPVYTAIREAREETGINVKVIQKLCTTNYTFSRLICGQQRNKIVKNMGFKLYIKPNPQYANFHSYRQIQPNKFIKSTFRTKIIKKLPKILL